jgi:glycolate oxidase FAD binding subunit
MPPATKLEDFVSPAQIQQREGKPIVSPQSTQQVAAIARYANQHSLAIEITGAGTKRGWGNPVNADLLLDTTRLTGVLSHSWQDLTATVAAGTTWADMQRALTAHNQFVALDPLWPDRATVGGIIATNDSGAWRLKYGSLRDLIIGMTIVLADGTIAKSGGKVVKNVAGYDLHKLMTGAFGTLGIITEVTFRLHPLPKHSQSFTASASQAAQLAPLMAAITDSHLLLEAMQLRCDSNGFHLDIQLNAHPDANQPTILQSMVIASKVSLNFSQGSTDIWLATQRICEQQNKLIVKATMMPDQVTAFAQEVEDKEGECVVQSLGTMHAAMPCQDSTSVRLAEEFRYHLGLEMGTTMLLSRAPIYDDCERWALITEGETPPALPLMREIKRQFDPNRILNPGRFIGGI